jgi:predicted double-glycine peptidase
MRGRLHLAMLIAAPLVLTSTARAGEVPVVGNQLYNVQLHTFIDLRFKNMVRQTRDLSCGAAAVATLLTYYYGDDVTEQQAIEAMLKLGDSGKIEKDGFSMLELKRFGEARGYQTAGFKLADAESLKKLQVPVVTLIHSRGYSHFVVVKGVVGDTVYIADPAYGNRTRRLDSFDPDWNNVVLVFLSPTRTGNNQFGHDSVVRAPGRGTITILEQGTTTRTFGAGEF